MKQQMTQKKAIKLIFSIGNNLLFDLADEKKQDMTLTQYGEFILEKYPDLLFFKEFKKGGK